MENVIIFQGRLTKDIELKYTTSQVASAEFTVAWSEKYKETETKCFLRCKAWRNTAEFISKFFAKGSEIIIHGKMVTEEWTDKDGNKQNRTICLVEKAFFCGSKSNSGQNNSSQSNSTDTSFMNIADNVEDEGLPFD